MNNGLSLQVVRVVGALQQYSRVVDAVSSDRNR
jgi:hypothetical protein